MDFAYNALGQWSSITRYASLDTSELVATTGYSYDLANRLTALTHQDNTPATFAGYDYTYDAASRITSIDSHLDGLSEYTYDNAGQLTDADHATQTDEEYAYDDNGNRIGGDYDTDPNNLTIEDDDYTYAYDDEGNRVLRTDKTTGDYVEYTWDHRNRLTLVTFKNSSNTTTKQVAYEYDAFDRRVRKRVDTDGNSSWDRGEQYVYDGAHIVMVFDDSGDLIRRNLFGPAIDQILASEFIGSPNDTHWYFADHLGTVRDVYSFDDVLNDLVSEGHIEYDSFGNIVDGAAVAEEARFAYTGREWDADAELYYYRARWYDPVLGKFISPDPIGLGPDYNARRYVENQPTMLTDPSGLAPNWRMPDADGNYAYPARFNYWDGVSTGQSPYKDRKDDPTAFQLFGVWHTAHTEIKSIPRVKIGQKPPGFKEYVTKNIDLGNRKTPCEDARSSIRTNLMHFKVMLVNHIAGVLLVQKQLSPSEKEEIANLIADWYILAVDKFLEEHWGAAPSQGTRNLIADRIGLQDDKNHPWCADWAQELVSQSSSLQDKRVMAGGVEVGITSLIRIDGFQYQTTFYQHNYLGMWTYGTATDPPSKNPNFLIFDPWINLRPQTYTNQVHPAPPTSQTLK